MSLGLEEPRPSKKYGVEEGKKIAQIFGVKPMARPKELVALVRYEDGVSEMVPTAVIADSSPKVGTALTHAAARCAFPPNGPIPSVPCGVFDGAD